MGDNTGSAIPGHGAAPAQVEDKGKGKAVEPQEDISMGEEEDDSSDEEDEVVEDIGEEEDDDAGDDNLEPISTDNIIQGRRTRNRDINYAEEAAKSGEAMDDDEEDEDFKAPGEDTEMKG